MGAMSTSAAPAPVLAPGVLVSAAPAESPTVAREDQAATAMNVPWNVVVWDDPVNLMSYVTWVFRRHFGHSQAQAHRLMLQVHEEGRAVVFTGSREEAERHTAAMHGYGLWATFEKDGE